MQSLANINFVEREFKNYKQLGVYMPGYYWVPKAEIVLSWEIANAHMTEIDWSKKVCSETIFTEDIWGQFGKSVTQHFGRCLKYFSVHGMLPIEVANPGKKGKRFYKPKGW